MFKSGFHGDRSSLAIRACDSRHASGSARDGIDAVDLSLSRAVDRRRAADGAEMCEREGDDPSLVADCVRRVAGWSGQIEGVGAFGLLLLSW